MRKWVEYIDLDNVEPEGEDVDIFPFDDMPVVIGMGIESAFDPWANEPTQTYIVPPELLALCRENN